MFLLLFVYEIDNLGFCEQHFHIIYFNVYLQKHGLNVYIKLQKHITEMALLSYL